MSSSKEWVNDIITTNHKKVIFTDSYLPMYSKNTMAAKHNPVKSIENRECDIENIQFVWKFGSSLYIKNSMFQCFPG